MDSIIGPSPLWVGEDDVKYNKFRSEVRASIEPTDVMELVWTKDYCDHVWELSRLRGILANQITANQYKGLCEVLSPINGPVQAKTLSAAWLARKPDALEEVSSSRRRV
jgi:hypothetical protein